MIKQYMKHLLTGFLCFTFLFYGFTGTAQEQKSSEGYIKTSDGLSLFYSVDGVGGDPVVILHGGPGLSMSYLRPDLLKLSLDRTLIFYDQRGSGRSTVTSDPKKLQVSRFVEDLDLVRCHFNLEKMTLLAHSWGTGLAALYAIKYPDRVKEMILVGPMEVRSNPNTAQFLSKMTSWMDEKTHKRFSELAALQETAKDVKWCNEFYSLLFQGYFSDPLKIKQMHGDFCSDPKDALLNGHKVDPIVIKELGNWDWRKPLRSVKARTFVIYGSDDIFPVESAQEWAESLPNAKLLVISESGHFPYIEQPEIFLSAVKDFLKGNWPANSLFVGRNN